MYISETDRFKSKDNYFQKQEKQLKENKHLNKINTIKQYNEQFVNKNALSLVVSDQKKLYSLLQRTEKMFKYEMINKQRNELIE